MRRVGKLLIDYRLLEQVLDLGKVRIIDHWPKDPWKKGIALLVEGQPFDEVEEWDKVPEYWATYQTEGMKLIEFQRRE